MTTLTKDELEVTPTQKTIASAANLANLLPTGTVLAFQTLIPSFTNNGVCHDANKGLAISIIVICSFVCLFTSFTDSFIDSTDGKFYYGIITRNGMYILNPRTEKATDEEKRRLRKYRMRPTDFFHAIMSLIVFLIFALTNLNVKLCFFPDASDDLNQLGINLPLGAGVLVSFLFTIFPTTRRGIGYTQPRLDKKKKSGNLQASITTTPSNPVLGNGSDMEMGV